MIVKRTFLNNQHFFFPKQNCIKLVLKFNLFNTILIFWSSIRTLESSYLNIYEYINNKTD
jgi:hypothetical protein